MNDDDDDDIADTHGLNAIACFQHGNGYVLSLMDDHGTLTTFTLSGPKLRQVATVICNAIQGIPSGSMQALRDLGYRDK